MVNVKDVENIKNFLKLDKVVCSETIEILYIPTIKDDDFFSKKTNVEKEIRRANPKAHVIFKEIGDVEDIELLEFKNESGEVKDDETK